MTLKIGLADPAAPEVAALVQAHVDRSRAYYPAESCHSFDAEELTRSGVELFVGRTAGEPVVIGGLLRLDARAAEIKSVFATAAVRGRGYGRDMMQFLMRTAAGRGHTHLFLETGSDAASEAARKLYEGLGFRECGAFGNYRPDPLSIFMSAQL